MNGEPKNIAEENAKPGRGLLALLRAVGWGAGVALGVAAGAWLTVVSGSGTPGTESLDRGDVVVLPLAAGAATVAVVLLIEALIGALRSRAAKRPSGSVR
ncbi:MAG: hypothetical protein AB2L09_02405 [Coriobacteriia bacterium]